MHSDSNNDGTTNTLTTSATAVAAAAAVAVSAASAASAAASASSAPFALVSPLRSELLLLAEILSAWRGHPTALFARDERSGHVRWVPRVSLSHLSDGSAERVAADFASWINLRADVHKFVKAFGGHSATHGRCLQVRRHSETAGYRTVRQRRLGRCGPMQPQPHEPQLFPVHMLIALPRRACCLW